MNESHPNIEAPTSYTVTPRVIRPSIISTDKNMFIKTVCTEKNYTFKPTKNDLIIFNSYLEHSVNNTSSKQTDRISLPFDLIF